MKPGALLAILMLAASMAAAKEPAMGTPRELMIADFSQYAVPQGWTTENGAAQGDPQITLSRDMHAITVRLAGGKGSRYKTPSGFLTDFEARSTGGKPAEKLGNSIVAGARVTIYRRKISVRLPPPDTSGPAELITEEFCVVPAGKLFFVLRYSYSDTTPDPVYNGSKAWRQFLKDFKLKKKTPGKSPPTMKTKDPKALPAAE